MAVEVPWQYSTENGRAMAEGLRYPLAYDLPLNKTSVTYDLVGGGSAVTVEPLLQEGMFCMQNAKGAATKFWHADIGAASPWYGHFGVLKFNPSNRGTVKTFRLGGPGEPERVDVPPYVDYTAEALAEPTEYWTQAEDGSARLDDGLGCTLRIGAVPHVPIRKGVKPTIRSGQTLYAVDWWSVTIDPADVVNAIEIGHTGELTGFDDESGLQLWTVHLNPYPANRTPVPA